MVKPGGTGRPRLAISARLAPLPPNRSRSSALPSALPSPNVNTHLPAFTVSTAGLTAAGLAAVGLTAAGLGGTALLAAFGAGLARFLAGFLSGGLFFMALRAEAGAFARAGVDDFDFAAVFLDLATALAMTCKQSARGKGTRAL